MVNKSDQGADQPASVDLLLELGNIAERLEQVSEQGLEENIRQPLHEVMTYAQKIGEASSGSWIGHHANVYYKGFQPPPPGTHFSKEWGLGGSSEDWVEHRATDVESEIYERAGNHTLEHAQTFHGRAMTSFRQSQKDLASILEVVLENSDSTFLSQLQAEARELSEITESKFIELLGPQERGTSRDSRAIDQGRWIPPHISVLSRIYTIQHTIALVISLADISRQAESHISRGMRWNQTRAAAGPKIFTDTRIFIGHGRSHIWRELKDFIEDQLGIAVDEFNSIQVAGTSITDRLLEMLSSATIALLVMTGEDEQPTGELRPRENVVHEAGLFQGRLGFRRAIVLLEEGCEKFSNNAGLVHISFPRGNIRAAFQDIREVLEREEILNKVVSQ